MTASTHDVIENSPGRQVARDAPSTRVCVVGLGFVGAALAAAVASARRPDGSAAFEVIGLEQDSPDGRAKVKAIADGGLVFANTDEKLAAALSEAKARGNLAATTDASVLSSVQIVVVDINLDLTASDGRHSVDYGNLRAAVRMLAERLPRGALIMVETTVPPGTCARVLAPEIDAVVTLRGLPPHSILLAHSYERVMPGPDYFDSIVNYWRVYAGHTLEAANACEKFLSQFVNVERFPLKRLPTTTDSETAKVLENSYRAVTIALMEEWGRFAEAAGVDLLSIVDAVRMRPTHSNIRRPGFGVGGYCLTKDPLFAAVAAHDLFKRDDLAFPFCRQAVDTNNAMPFANIDRLTAHFAGSLQGKKILLLGVTYREDTADTRLSPSEIFYREAQARGADVVVHDPLICRWDELAIDMPAELPGPESLDAVVFAVPHRGYRDIDWLLWLGDARPVMFDANDVLPPAARAQLKAAGVSVIVTGIGDAV
jgi:nucleotide sugar dehydrogenase